jgi:uncharacterized protein (DUF169 family)
MAHEFEQLLKMATPPVALRFIRTDESVPSGLLRQTKCLTFCQFVSAATTGGYPFLLTRENLGCLNARVNFGLEDYAGDPEVRASLAKSHVGSYARDLETAFCVVDSKPKIPFGWLQAIAVAPLGKATFTPDVLILPLLPWQAYFAINGYLYEIGESSLLLRFGANSLMCSYLAVYAGYGHEINLATACSGGHAYAGIQTIDMFLAAPWEKAEAMLRGLSARSMNYPYPGMIAMPTPAPMPTKHILRPDRKEQ